MLASYSSQGYNIGAASHNDVAESGATIGHNKTNVKSNSASVTHVVGTTSGASSSTYSTTTTQSFSYNVGANGYDTTSVVFRGRASMSTYTGTRDV